MEEKTERLINLLKQVQNKYSEEYIIFMIPEFLSKKFIAYCAMKEDLELLLEYINVLRNEKSHLIKSSLTYSLIALYGKCFTDGSQNSNSKLEPNHLFANNEQNMEIHNYMMNLRHQFIAHRGDTESEIGVAFMIIPKKGNVDEKQIQFNQLKRSSFSSEKLNLIEILIKSIIEDLKVSIQKNGEKLNDSYLKIFTPEQISIMSVNNAK